MKYINRTYININRLIIYITNNINILLNKKKLVINEGHIHRATFGLPTPPLCYHCTFDITPYISKNTKRYHSNMLISFLGVDIFKIGTLKMISLNIFYMYKGLYQS